MVEWLRDAERVEGSDAVPGSKQDDVKDGELHHLNGEGREGVEQWRDQAVLRDSSGEDDTESAPDTDSEGGGDDDSDLKTDGVSASNAIALAAKNASESRPSFGNIVVNSSSDVHFGNKNFYNGPVTIKQFVYTTRDGGVDGHPSEADGDIVDSQVNVVEGFEPVPSGLSNGEVQCPVSPSENFKSALSPHTLTSELSPQSNGNLFWQSSTGQQGSLAERKSSVQQRVCKVVKSRPCLVTAVLVTCAVVLVVTLLVSFPPREEATGTGTLEQVPEDGIISPQFNYEATNNTPSGQLKLVNRRTWLAQPAVARSNSLTHPLPYVVILHTATETCNAQAACVFIVRNIQTYHIESYGWNDIGYSFLVGGDGSAYEGRGWDIEGAFAYGYNKKAIGIGFIGTFTSELPTPNQLEAGKQLIDLGVKLGKISPEYKLLAHRQVSATESPGLEFFKLLKTWPHWAEKP